MKHRKARKPTKKHQTSTNPLRNCQLQLRRLSNFQKRRKKDVIIASSNTRSSTCRDKKRKPIKSKTMKNLNASKWISTNTDRKYRQPVFRNKSHQSLVPCFPKESKQWRRRRQGPGMSARVQIHRTIRTRVGRAWPHCYQKTRVEVSSKEGQALLNVWKNKDNSLMKPAMQITASTH